MNQIYNTQQREKLGYHLFESKMVDAKKGLSFQPDSLFSMALYDFDAMAANQEALPSVTPAFHPVEEYKDVSLKEILELSDDFLLGDDEALPSSTTLNNSAVSYSSSTTSSAPVATLSAPKVPSVQAQVPFSVTSFGDANQDNKVATHEEQLSSNKRNRDVLEADKSCDDSSHERRFRPYQAGQWAEKFEELCQYRDRMGHCLVPHTYKENLPLARWVKRQRYQYKLMMEGKASTMTLERVKALEDIGFIWDSQGAAWGERLDELREFRKTYLHCNVPSNFSENPQLATWVKCQRRQYKLHMEGKPSNMTERRVRELEALGFEWELRTYKRARTC